MVTIHIDRSGPIFNGEAKLLADRMCHDIQRDVSAAGKGMVLDNLGSSLKHPTGYYESRIRTEPRGNDTAVTDGGVVYGPWLEGTGSRNRTTRFKGYATFRRTTEALRARAREIAERAAEPFIRRMG